MTTQPSSTQEMADPAAAGTEKVDEETVDPAAASPELSVALGLSPSLGDMERMIASIRSGTGKVEAEEGDSVAVDAEQAAAVEGDSAPADPNASDTVAADAEPASDVEGDPVATDAEPAAAVQGDPVATDAEKAAAVEGDSVAVDTEKAAAEGAESAPTDPGDSDTLAVDAETAAAVEGDSVAADIEKAAAEGAESAPTGPDDADTVEMSSMGAALSGGQHPLPQLAEQQVLAPVPVQNRADKRRFGALALVATILAALLIGALFLASRDGGGVTAQSDPTVAAATATVSKPTSEPSDESTDTRQDQSTIQLEGVVDSAGPSEAVRIQGRYRGGADTFLRAQRLEGGEWVDFPIPTKTDQSGKFTTYVELGRPGRYRLRVMDPNSGVTSKTFVLVITG